MYFPTGTRKPGSNPLVSTFFLFLLLLHTLVLLLISAQEKKTRFPPHIHGKYLSIHFSFSRAVLDQNSHSFRSITFCRQTRTFPLLYPSAENNGVEQDVCATGCLKISALLQ